VPSKQDVVAVSDAALSAWAHSQSFMHEGTGTALDPDGYPYVVLAAAFEVPKDESDRDFRVRVTHLRKLMQDTLARLGSQSDLWIRRWPEMDYGTKPTNVPPGFTMEELWQHGEDIVALCKTTVRLTRKDHGPVDEAGMSIKLEGMPCPIVFGALDA